MRHTHTHIAENRIHVLHVSSVASNTLLQHQRATRCERVKTLFRFSTVASESQGILNDSFLMFLVSDIYILYYIQFKVDKRQRIIKTSLILKEVGFSQRYGKYRILRQ